MAFPTRLLTRRSKRGSLAEFGPVLFVFFFFALFPAIDLMGVAIGTATIALAARQGASSAASASDYGSGIAAMEREVNGVKNSGFGQFMKLVPVAGYNGSGGNLWVVQTDFNTSAVRYCGPNQKAPTPVNTTTMIYEYGCVCTYQVGPILPLGAIPFIGNIPGLGPPAPIKYVATVAVEYPDGLGAGTPPTGSWAATANY